MEPEGEARVWVRKALTEADACVSAEAEWGGASTVCETPCLTGPYPRHAPDFHIATPNMRVACNKSVIEILYH
jgi:hypothetical protein